MHIALIQLPRHPHHRLIGRYDDSLYAGTAVQTRQLVFPGILYEEIYQSLQMVSFKMTSSDAIVGLSDGEDVEQRQRGAIDDGAAVVDQVL